MFETAESDDNAEVFLSVDTLQSQTDQIENEHSSRSRAKSEVLGSEQGSGHGSPATISLPHPDVLRAEIAKRDKRTAVFGSDLFSDPAWDMILELALATLLHRRVAVKALCIASRVPPTTALRHISVLVEKGIFRRKSDECDGRRSFVYLSDEAIKLVARYFAASLDPNPTSSYMRP